MYISKLIIVQNFFKGLDISVWMGMGTGGTIGDRGTAYYIHDDGEDKTSIRKVKVCDNE